MGKKDTENDAFYKAQVLYNLSCAFQKADLDVSFCYVQDMFGMPCVKIDYPDNTEEWVKLEAGVPVADLLMRILKHIVEKMDKKVPND